MEHLLEHILETLLESLMMLPFLFAAYLLLEYVEHKAGDKMIVMLQRAHHWSVPVGAAAGLIPQCGFSVAASNLYAGGLISAGTLLAVFLSTSDEALILLLAHPESTGLVFILLGIKLLAGICGGFLLDLLMRRQVQADMHHNELCTACGCDEEHGILKPALKHTLHIYLFIVVVSVVLHVTIHLIGEERLAALLMHGSIAQVFISGLIGLIPNCAASVVLTELFLSGGLSFGALTAGLCTSAGMGLVVLFKTNRHLKNNLHILAFLYIFSILVGLLAELLPV